MANPIQNYAQLLQHKALNAPMQTLAQTLDQIPIKPFEFLHGEPIIKWKKKHEVKQSIVQQGLQLVVLGKFSYGKLVITKLLKVIPIQCELKGGRAIGLIEIIMCWYDYHCRRITFISYLNKHFIWNPMEICGR